MDDKKHGGLDTYNGMPVVAKGEHYLCDRLVKSITLVPGVAPPKLENRKANCYDQPLNMLNDVVDYLGG